MLDYLKQFVPVVGDSQEKTVDVGLQSEEEFSRYLKLLVQDGKRIQAIGALRSRKGLSTTEAHCFVEELDQQLSAGE